MRKRWSSFREFAENELKWYVKHLPEYRKKKCPLSFVVLRMECENGHVNKTFIPFGELTCTSFRDVDVVRWESCGQVKDIKQLIEFFRSSWDDLCTSIMSRHPKCPICGTRVRIIGAVALFLNVAKDGSKTVPFLVGTSERGKNVAMYHDGKKIIDTTLPDDRYIFDTGPSDYIV